MYLCRETAEKPLNEIGETFGIKYAAVSLALKRVKEKLVADSKFANGVRTYKEALINKLKTQFRFRTFFVPDSP